MTPKDHYMNPHNAPSSMMTLDEMKLAVCEKLPKLIVINHEGDTCWLPMTQYCEQETGCLIHWPTEGLQVCHEAEKLLIKQQAQNYMDNISNIVRQTSWPQSIEEAQMLYLNATYEQRLEALCRVWWPERFK